MVLAVSPHHLKNGGVEIHGEPGREPGLSAFRAVGFCLERGKELYEQRSIAGEVGQRSTFTGVYEGASSAGGERDGYTSPGCRDCGGGAGAGPDGAGIPETGTSSAGAGGPEWPEAGREGLP